GHTLGLQHNFAASTTNRASVMDYPGPLVKLGADGLPDISDAYARGIGEWGKVTIAYGYQDFPAGTDEHAALDKILSDAFTRSSARNHQAGGPGATGIIAGSDSPAATGLPAHARRLSHPHVSEL